MNGIGREYLLDPKNNCAHVKVELQALGDISAAMLDLLEMGAYIGKLFAADERRRVRDPDYLMRMFGRSDRRGRPLLSLGGLDGSRDLILEKNEGRTVAFSHCETESSLTMLRSMAFCRLWRKRSSKTCPTLVSSCICIINGCRNEPRIVKENEILLVRTAPLHIRTVYARVVDKLLPQGYHHTTANVLQPDTADSGDIYELFGSSNQILDDIPLEFYTLEPHREHVFFADRDQLQACLEDPASSFRSFSNSPRPRKSSSLCLRRQRHADEKPVCEGLDCARSL